MPFSLPALPFDPAALAPWSSAETFSYHHGKHHAAYLNKLNAAIEGRDLAEKSLVEIIVATHGLEPGIFNNAAQSWNHEMFWQSLTADTQEPGQKLAELISRDFGSLEKFRAEYTQAAMTLFGSGWVWLIQTVDDRLAVRQYGNAETPAGTTDRGLLPLDVWEHSYYIDHRNDRAAFIEGFWQHVNWSLIEKRLA
ncbi:MAG: superoxide dismutase [Patescibacteria group bacterium]